MKDRLKRLKNELSLEWGELAEKLEISRSMLDHVRNGRRSFGPKAMRRLDQIEADAGLRVATAVREYTVANDAGELRDILDEMGGIKEELDALSLRVDLAIKKLRRN